MVWPISTSVITSLITHTYRTVSSQMDQYWQPMALLYANVQVCCIKQRILSTDPRRYVTVNFACYSPASPLRMYIFASKQLLEPLPTLLMKETLTEDEMLECKRVRTFKTVIVITPSNKLTL